MGYIESQLQNLQAHNQSKYKPTIKLGTEFGHTNYLSISKDTVNQILELIVKEKQAIQEKEVKTK